MILAPATMASQSDPKVAAAKCLEEVELDPENYRIGHTKASLRKLYQYFPLESRDLFYSLPSSEPSISLVDYRHAARPNLPTYLLT